MQDMQEQGESQYDFTSRPFEVSRLSSSKQLDKLSERLSSCSKNRKSSMMEQAIVQSSISAFDFEQSSQKIDSRKASNVDDQSSNRPHRLSQSYTKEKDSGAENYQMFDEVPDFTAIDKFQELHQCLCSKANCSEDGCPCMLAINQQCVVGICCRVCIQKKSQLFFQKANNIVVNNKQKKKKQSKQHQHTKQQKKQVKRPPKSKVDKQKYEFAFCSCKKSHCLKKYCPCFAANKKCNQCCACDDCQNKSQAENDNNQLPQKKLGVQEGNELNSGTNGENSNDNQKSEPIYIQMAQQDIDNYFQQSPLDYSNVELNREMNFQPADFAQYRR